MALIELVWKTQGYCPKDYHYRTYAALASLQPLLKERDWQLVGFEDGTFRVRCSPEDIPLFPYDGTVLTVSHSTIRLFGLEAQTVVALPEMSLIADIVLIKSQFHCRTNLFGFGVSVGQQLASLGIKRHPTLLDKRTLQIKTEALVGYTLGFEKLTQLEASALLHHGIGGRRRMGAGVFKPWATTPTPS